MKTIDYSSIMGKNNPILNIAETCVSTRALGPGLRSAIWVQGCPINCKGCIAPEWIPFNPAHFMTPEVAANLLLKEPGIEGITISGGEPMAQAYGLTRMAQILRKRKELHIICFSGYRHEYLIKQPVETGIPEFLAMIDILVDGPYIQNLNQGTTFAGSSNQRIISLSQRPIPGNSGWPLRKMELHIRNGMILSVGVPPLGWNRRFADNISRMDA